MMQLICIQTDCVLIVTKETVRSNQDLTLAMKSTDVKALDESETFASAPDVRYAGGGDRVDVAALKSKRVPFVPLLRSSRLSKLSAHPLYPPLAVCWLVIAVLIMVLQLARRYSVAFLVLYYAGTVPLILCELNRIDRFLARLLLRKFEMWYLLYQTTEFVVYRAWEAWQPSSNLGRASCLD
mgnify:CR=1 FL=1